LKVWTWKLCLFIINHIYNNKCDSWSCHYMCEEGFTFQGFVVGRLRWSSMERSYVKLCTMSPSTCGWSSGSIITCSYVGLWCILHKESWGVATMLVCDHCSKGWHIGCIIAPIVNVPIGDSVCPCAPNNHVVLC
jgi:hypothetical protein